MRFCPTCRTDFPGDPPPYSVIHVMVAPHGHEVIGGPSHLDVETRQPVEPLPEVPHGEPSRS